MKEEDYTELFERQEIKDAIANARCFQPSIGMLWLIQRGRCYWCDITCMKPCKRTRRQFGQKTLPTNFFTLDHVQSRWQGGCGGAENVVGACSRCNHLRNNAEHKREAGKYIPPNQPEETRLKRFLPVAIYAMTIPFERGLTRKESKKSHLRFGSQYGRVLELHEKQQDYGFGA